MMYIDWQTFAGRGEDAVRRPIGREGGRDGSSGWCGGSSGGGSLCFISNCSSFWPTHTHSPHHRSGGKAFQHSGCFPDRCEGIFDEILLILRCLYVQCACVCLYLNDALWLGTVFHRSQKCVLCDSRWCVGMAVGSRLQSISASIFNGTVYIANELSNEMTGK